MTVSRALLNYRDADQSYHSLLIKQMSERKSHVSRIGM